VDEEWWYRVTNQDHLRVFTPLGTQLTAATGGKARVITPRTKYTSGWEADPDVLSMESTLKPIAGFPAVSRFQESGRNVFVTWLTTPAGQTSKATFEYRRALKAPFKDGAPYTFVFERQSGAEQALYVTLNAPPGFVWAATGVSKYEYVNLSVPGRVVLELALQKI
jgi:hypothetical protein